MLGCYREGKSGHLRSLGIVGTLFSGVLECLVGFCPQRSNVQFCYLPALKLRGLAFSPGASVSSSEKWVVMRMKGDNVQETPCQDVTLCCSCSWRQ